MLFRRQVDCEKGKGEKAKQGRSETATGLLASELTAEDTRLTSKRKKKAC